MTTDRLREDWVLPKDGRPEKGGNDKIYGGDGVTLARLISGGPYDDKIWTGSNNGLIVVYGDKSDVPEVVQQVVNLELDEIAPETNLFPDGGNSLPFFEFPDTFNKYDGDDVIDVGNDNMAVKVFGQGANDKIIGGWGDD